VPFISTILLAIAGVAPLTQGDTTRTIEFGDRSRSYVVHVPPKYDPKRPTPVVLVFHGGASSGRHMARFCRFNEKADQETFIAVYPNGTGRSDRVLTWNGGNCCGYAVLHKIDDVGFVRALLDDLAKSANVDPKRVYATGMSNGGILCYRLASELSDRIAAIAPISGTMGTPTCHPKRPVPVIHFHGSDDQYVPFKGGIGPKSIALADFRPVDDSIHAWVKADRCPEKPAVEDLPAKIDDGTSVQRKTYGPGKNGSEVVLYVTHGGGHTWPGVEPAIKFLGKSTKNISANDLIWDFFKKHPMP
jgi:polyhydroxybutyrate depolymerase